MNRSRSNRRPFLVALVSGLAGSGILALSLTGTLSAFTATIQNSANTVGGGTLTMRETSGSATCNSTDGNTNNSATCSTINKYGGGTLKPGETKTTTVTIANTGSMAAGTFTLAPGTCAQSGAAPTGVTGATDLCAKLKVSIYAGTDTSGTPINGAGGTTLAALSSMTLTPLAAGASQQYTFVVSAPADLTNAYQGLTASQTLTWTFTA